MKTKSQIMWATISAAVSLHCAAADTNILRSGHYFLERSEGPQKLVATVNARDMLSRRLDHFEYRGEEEIDSAISRYTFFNPGITQKVEVSMATYSSVSNAEENVLARLNSISGMFKSGTPSEIQVGNSCWHIQARERGPVTIIFVRRNVVVTVFSGDLNIAESLAKQIDQEIYLGGSNVVMAGQGQSSNDK